MEGTLIFVAFFGLVMVVLAIFYNTLFDLGEQQFSKSECQTSLLFTRATQENIDAYASIFCFTVARNPIPLKCSRRYITVTGDDVLSGGESIKFQYNPSCDGDLQLAEAAVHNDYTAACLEENVLAREMASCWNTFFAGEVPVFQQVEEDVAGIFNKEGNDRACFVCAEVTLQTGEDITGFTDYLKRKRYAADKTFYDYLTKNRMAFCNPDMREDSDDGTCWQALSKVKPGGWLSSDTWPGLDQDTFEDEQVYAVTFVRYGMNPECNEDEIPTMSVQVLPAERIGEYCHVVLV